MKMRAQYDGAEVIGFRLTDIPEDKTMQKLKLRRITNAASRIGAFDENGQLVGPVDEPSYNMVRRSFEEGEEGEGGAKNSDTAELMEFIKKNITVLSALPEDLAVPVAKQWMKSGSYTIALKEATRSPELAQLWEQRT